MSNQNYEKRKRHIFRSHTTRHKPQASIAPKIVSDKDRTSSIAIKSQKKSKAKIRIEDKGTVRTNRFLF